MRHNAVYLAGSPHQNSNETMGEIIHKFSKQGLNANKET